VLLDGTTMPDIGLLPDDLKELVDRQAESVEYRTFDADVERLIRKLGLAAPDPQVDAKGQPHPCERRKTRVEISSRRPQAAPFFPTFHPEIGSSAADGTVGACGRKPSPTSRYMGREKHAADRSLRLESFELKI
jgi:hypothetical protein